MDTDDHYVRFKNNIVGWIIIIDENSFSSIIDALKLKIITLSRILDFFFVAYPSVFIIKNHMKSKSI